MKIYLFILKISFVLCVGDILMIAQGNSPSKDSINTSKIDSLMFEPKVNSVYQFLKPQKSDSLVAAPLPQKENIRSKPQSTVVSDYFPLKVGFQWTYKMPAKNGNINQLVEVTEYDQDNFHVKTTLNIGKEIVESEDLIEVEGNKVTRTGSWGLKNEDWQASSGLLLQYPLKAKSSWKQGDSRRTEYSVIGFLNLTVEAGTFYDVCKIKKTVKELKMEFYIYLAPNIGLIKEELINKDKSTTTFRELTGYKFEEKIITKKYQSKKPREESVNLNARQIDFMERLSYSLQQHHNEGAQFLVFLALGGYNEDPGKIQRKADAGMADRTVLPAIMKEFRKQYAEQKFTNYRARALNDIFLSLTEEECADLINMSDTEITSLANKYADYYAREGREFQQLPKY